MFPLVHIDVLVQERSNSSALAMKLCLSCTKPLIFVIFYLNTIENSVQYLLFGVTEIWKETTCLAKQHSIGKIYNKKDTLKLVHHRLFLESLISVLCWKLKKYSYYYQFDPWKQTSVKFCDNVLIKKMYLKMWSEKWRPFCSYISVLIIPVHNLAVSHTAVLFWPCNREVLQLMAGVTGIGNWQNQYEIYMAI